MSMRRYGEGCRGVGSGRFHGGDGRKECVLVGVRLKDLSRTQCLRNREFRY